jgi:hypothetical protein
MATLSSPPILVWTPGGGVPVGPVSNPPVYSQAGTTHLINGQAYIDVVFGSVQTTDTWVLVECVVVNEIDVDPLNIWPGIITDKTAAGFRLQLNGMPDSANYYLHWAVSGINIAPTPATSYLLTGPSTGVVGVSSTFTVSLPPSTTLSAVVTITPHDGGAGGSFNVDSVTLSTGSASATFAYTPASYGSVTISVTNSSTLNDPPALTLSVFASTYTLFGPSSGNTGVPSTNFTVALPVGGVVAGTVTVTPSSGGGGGTFTPTTVALTTAAPSATFTYTPASTGTKTISVTNNGGLTNPGNISYVVSAPFAPTDIAGLKLWLKADSMALADGATVVTWNDSSGNGNNFTNAGNPIFKTNIVNGKPVVRYSPPSTYHQSAAVSIAPSQFTVLIVAAVSSIGAQGVFYDTGQAGATSFYFLNNSGTFYQGFFTAPATPVTATEPGGLAVGVWNVLATDWNGTNIHIWRNGTLKNTTGATTRANTGTSNTIGISLTSAFGSYSGDIAEVLVYDSSLSATDRVNVENYLGAKYGITIVPTLLRLEEIRDIRPQDKPAEQ